MAYNVTVPGKYHLNMLWYRENYLGANEKIGEIMAFNDHLYKVLIISFNAFIERCG